MDLEISKTRFLLAIALFAVLGGSTVYATQLALQYFHHNPQVSANVFVFRETPQGIDMIYGGNVITDIGEQYVRNILGFNNVTNHNATQWIALGNSTIDQTNSKLDTEASSLGFERAANDTCVAWINSGDYAYNVTKKFTATGTIQVNATALHWSSVAEAADAFAMASLGGAQNFENNWNCTIVWVITWNGN